MYVHIHYTTSPLLLYTIALLVYILKIIGSYLYGNRVWYRVYVICLVWNA